MTRLAQAWTSSPRWMALPALVPLVAVVLPFVAPALWLPAFGKETAGEHLSHVIFLIAVVIFLRRYVTSIRRTLGDLVLGLGTAIVFLEEIDYGLLYLHMVSSIPRLDSEDVFHNTPTGIAVFFVGPVLFSALPWALSETHTFRRQWLPVTRTTAAASWLAILYLFVAQFCPHVIDGYSIREGADEVHDLSFALAVLVTALRPEPSEPA